MEKHAVLITEIPTLSILQCLVDSMYYFNMAWRKEFPNTPRLAQMARYAKEERQRVTIELESNQAVKPFKAIGFEDLKCIDRMVREYEQYGVTLVDCEDIVAEWCAEQTLDGNLCYPKIYPIENNEGRKSSHVMALFPDGMTFDVSLTFGMPPAREGETITIIEGL